ncbi:MAG: DUF5320 domain-containing protein [Acidobacteria bacterium]|nr:DUF5320 domain-containing protein [Acidobacteriota bacterium]
MPGGDRTGPMGMGARTGRAAGYCAGYGSPGYANPGFGRSFGVGFGRGRGFFGRGRGFSGGGRGWRNMFYATGQPGWMRFGGHAVPYPYPNPYQAAYQKPDPEAETQALKNQAEILQSELDAIEKRLSEIKAEATNSTP